jgi:hypothetical protein
MSSFDTPLHEKSRILIPIEKNWDNMPAILTQNHRKMYDERLKEDYRNVDPESVYNEYDLFSANIKQSSSDNVSNYFSSLRDIIGFKIGDEMLHNHSSAIYRKSTT